MLSTDTVVKIMAHRKIGTLRSTGKISRSMNDLTQLWTDKSISLKNMYEAAEKESSEYVKLVKSYSNKKIKNMSKDKEENGKNDTSREDRNKLKKKEKKEKLDNRKSLQQKESNHKHSHIKTESGVSSKFYLENSPEEEAIALRTGGNVEDDISLSGIRKNENKKSFSDGDIIPDQVDNAAVLKGPEGCLPQKEYTKGQPTEIHE